MILPKLSPSFSVSRPSSTSFFTRVEKSITLADSSRALAMFFDWPSDWKVAMNSWSSATVQVGQAETT